uniref:hypothetical protein n=1 Tax=Salmonella sp. s51228 TaxID=3159652 RepID=UPI0039805990
NKLALLFIILTIITTTTTTVSNNNNNNIEFTDTARNNTNNTLTKSQMIIDISLTIIPVICYGSNYVPVKKYDTLDGMFFQWVLCTAILIVGFIAYSVQLYPTFYTLACIGGALWAIGNACVVIIIKTIGLSLGLMIWATTGLVVGWA